jgi:hypothetical protein
MEHGFWGTTEQETGVSAACCCALTWFSVHM